MLLAMNQPNILHFLLLFPFLLNLLNANWQASAVMPWSRGKQTPDLLMGDQC